MTCRDIMTENPSCCTPTDTAAAAARLMKSEDVGPIPIVEDESSKRLIGIVTDRDLAVKVVAEGRDPNSMQLQEIMSRSLVTCRPDDDISEVMEAMADHQIRRIAVVDENRCLLGIVSQADVARHVHQEEVGDVVEEISEPGGFSIPGRLLGGTRRSQEGEYQSTGSSLLAAAIGFGVGAGLMYLLDPNTGRRRRAMARDKAMSWSKSTASEVSRRAKDIGNRASGLMSEVRSVKEGEEEESSDQKLVDRIRAELGHVVSNAHHIQVSSRDGHVTLMGYAPESEIDPAISCAAGVRGVKSVDNRLRASERQQQEHPAYQGGENRRM